MHSPPLLSNCLPPAHGLAFLSLPFSRPCRRPMSSPCFAPIPQSQLVLTSFLRRLATSAHTLAKNHSVAHSPHAKSGFPALTNSPVMRGYTATIIVRPLPAGPVKRTRCLYPLLMAGMMRTPLSPGESPKRRLGAEQTATMRCVLDIPRLALPLTF
jgi:hypothetical protein